MVGGYFLYVKTILSPAQKENRWMAIRSVKCNNHPSFIIPSFLSLSLHLYQNNRQYNSFLFPLPLWVPLNLKLHIEPHPKCRQIFRVPLWDGHTTRFIWRLGKECKAHLNGFAIPFTKALKQWLFSSIKDDSMEDSVADREQKNQLRECFMLTTIEKIRNIGLKQPNWLYERARKKGWRGFRRKMHCWTG